MRTLGGVFALVFLMWLFWGLLQVTEGGPDSADAKNDAQNAVDDTDD